MEEAPLTIEQWLQRLKVSQKGKLKIYIGMSAGVGKTYRMLQEAHQLMQSGTNVLLGYVETHGRKETESLLPGLPQVPRREVFYKGKRLQELDTSAIFLLQPELVIVDELAHSNIPGSRNEKRWQDVMELLDHGIDVITAVNIQHLESIHDDVKKITGIDIQERIPDKILQVADEVVNIDLPADELIRRLKEGKIYNQSRIQQALSNFFQPEKILQLRELALKEVAGQVERKVDYEISYRKGGLRHERFLACISSNAETAKKILRKSARLASYYNSSWHVLYVQTPREALDKIPLASQRHLINNFKLATELGAEVVQKKGSDVSEAILETIDDLKITTLCLGKPHFGLLKIIMKTSIFNKLLQALSKRNIDLVIFS